MGQASMAPNPIVILR